MISSVVETYNETMRHKDYEFCTERQNTSDRRANRHAEGWMEEQEHFLLASPSTHLLTECGPMAATRTKA